MPPAYAARSHSQLAEEGEPVEDRRASLMPKGFAAGRVCVGGVDGDLARQAGDRAQRRRDGRPQDRHHDDVGATSVAAATAQFGHSWPALRHSAASPPPTFPRPITTMFTDIPPIGSFSHVKGMFGRFPRKKPGILPGEIADMAE